MRAVAFVFAVPLRAVMTFPPDYAAAPCRSERPDLEGDRIRKPSLERERKHWQPAPP